MFGVQMLLYTVVLLVGLPLQALAAQCPITEVPQYQFRCGIEGDIRKPALIRTYTNISTAKACAKLCLKNTKCDTLRWVQQTSQCYTYSKYLDQMFTDFSNYEPGILWERECWTTDCNIIAACAASAPCSAFYDGYKGFYYVDFQQYACSYGKTAMSHAPGGPKYPITSYTFLNGSLSACEAIEQCGFNDFNGGSVDIHYSIPADQWECIVYGDLTGPKYEVTPSQEHLSRTRYSVINDTVGAGYGLMWLYSYEYCCG